MGLLTRGKLWGLLTPWNIEIDLERNRVHIEKRNWYLISKDEDTFQFSSVRHVKVDRSIFGADLHIRMYAGSASVYGISKVAAKTIATMLLDEQAKQEGRSMGDRIERELYNDPQGDDPRQ
ncbi:MAG: hypothetical protein U0U25_01840 [Flavobacteriales bacterium]